MGTTNTVSATAVRSNVVKHMEDVANKKSAYYKDYYSHFEPFIINLTGGATEASWCALRWICKKAGKFTRPSLQWEPDMWAVNALRKISSGMAKVTSWMAMRSDIPDEANVSLVVGDDGYRIMLDENDHVGSLLV